MSGLTNSGRPGSGKNRFRLGARITLPLVAEFCYLFNNWVCFAVDLLLRILAAGSTPKRRRQNHRIPPVAIRLNLLREKKTLLSLVTEELIESTPKRRRQNH